MHTKRRVLIPNRKCWKNKVWHAYTHSLSLRTLEKGFEVYLETLYTPLKGTVMVLLKEPLKEPCFLVNQTSLQTAEPAGVEIVGAVIGGEAGC